MIEIVRGDGMKYALAYNNGNGRLKQMTQANGHTTLVGKMITSSKVSK